LAGEAASGPVAHALVTQYQSNYTEDELQRGLNWMVLQRTDMAL